MSISSSLLPTTGRQLSIAPRLICKTSRTDAITFSAHAHTLVPTFKKVSVLFCKFMSAQTVSFSGVQRADANPAHSVNSRRHWIDMSRIYAMPPPTQMIRVILGRLNNLNEHLKSYAMSMPVAVSIKENAIAVLVYISSPKPARSSVKHYFRVYANSSKEASENCAVNTKSVRIAVGHRDLLKVNDGLGDVRLQPCAAFSF